MVSQPFLNIVKQMTTFSKNKKNYFSKDTVKSQATDWEKIFAQYLIKHLDPKSIMISQNAVIRKQLNFFKKWATTEQTLQQKRYTNSKCKRKGAGIISHEKCPLKLQCDTTTHPIQVD